MAFVAMVAGERGGEKEVAVARYVTNPDGTSCEFAIVVADEWQRVGLGRYMMAQLIEVARARGLSSMSGEILASNMGMQKLAMQLGFAIEQSPADPALRRATLSLSRG
jgi:acetyltransferase